MKYAVLILILFVATQAWAQEFSIKKVELAGDNINLYYDLLDETPQRSYTVSLYSSKDNFISTLEKVSGDIGLEVRPGANKKIVWKAKEELGPDFEGKVGLEVRGKIYIPFVRLDGLNKTFKRDRPYEITWTGGTQQNILNFDLYKGEEKVTSFPNIANVGHYTLTMPLTVKPGKGYRFMITDTRNKDQIVYSSDFGVRRKTPLLFKTIPAILIVGGIYVLTKGTDGPANIPDPINPPE